MKDQFEEADRDTVGYNEFLLLLIQAQFVLLAALAMSFVEWIRKKLA